MPRKEHHVVPNSDRGGWDVKLGGGDKSIKHFETKDPAIDYARGLSQNADSELIIHNKDGRIAGSDSHGNDPNPPKDAR